MSDKKLSDKLNTLERLPICREVDADKGYQGLAKQVTLVTVRNPETGEEQQVPRLQVYTPANCPAQVTRQNDRSCLSRRGA